ncbi:MAG: phosphomannomutase/phosphoglucomutase [Firmicutes bacterium]|nr:phosphomannomutase/phosphoglucomutase [Bacillota bacterium]
MGPDYLKLQNGSDIRGVAMDGAAGEKVNLGKEETFRLTRAFAAWLAEKTGKELTELTVSVGHDSRLSAEPLRETIVETLVSLGVKVYDCGLASTPAMFMSTVFPAYLCDGAVMITASHLPFNRNGFKYFDRDGGLNKEDIRNIIQGAQSDAVLTEIPRPSSRDLKEPEVRDLIGDYSAHLRDKICAEVARPDKPELPLEGLKIVVDAGNGAGGFYATRILAPLGADVSASQFLEPDGNFPNHAPNPENQEAMDSVCRAVKESRADLGLIFDTDVDRASAVDSSGRQISRNAIVAMAAALIAREHPGTTVVTDSITSDQLTVYLEECLGLKHLRFRRGYRNVINKSMELNAAGVDSQLAIETSGHAAYKENYFLDDGAYLATKIVIKAAQLKQQGVSLDVILSSLEEPKEAVEYRFPISAEDFGPYGDRILEDMKVWAAAGKNVCDSCGTAVKIQVVEPNYEGVRLNFRGEDLSGWCLLRKSLHDPIMPLNIEVTEGSCDRILTILKEFLRQYDQLKL